MQHVKIQLGTWVAQLVKYLTSAQVTISQFVSLSPMLGEPCFPLSLSLSLSAPHGILSLSFCPLLSCALSFSQNKIK